MSEIAMAMPPQEPFAPFPFYMNPVDFTPSTGEHDQIPTIDFSLLFSDDPDQRVKAMAHLASACDNYGFFYLINGVPENVVARALKGISDYFDQTTEEERMEYVKRDSMDRIRWALKSHAGENRECLKVVAHPQFHCPAKPSHFREALGEYFKSFGEVEIGLAKAISKILGFEETYIGDMFKLDQGFDVAAMNLYPPSFQSKGSIGLPDHTDPGLFVSLIQDVSGGLEIEANNGKRISANIPLNSILINLGDHLEILTNGKYKSHVHQVVVENNKIKRISLATLHGPALEAHVDPDPKFVNQSHPIAYRRMTYKESLQMNGDDEIDVQSNLGKIRFGAI